MPDSDPRTDAPTLTVPSPSSAPAMPPSFGAPPTAPPAPDPSAPDRLAERATELAMTATAALGTAADGVGDFVRRQQPLVMAVAFGTGVFIGLMIRRR